MDVPLPGMTQHPSPNLHKPSDYRLYGRIDALIPKPQQLWSPPQTGPQAQSAQTPPPLTLSQSLSPDPLCHLWLRLLFRRVKLLTIRASTPSSPLEMRHRASLKPSALFVWTGQLNNELFVTSSATWITLPILVRTLFFFFALPTIACLHLNMSTNSSKYLWTNVSTMLRPRLR